MTRAITSDELSKLRGVGQWSQLYLAVHTPATVFACRINQTISSRDKVTSLTYDGVTTGAYTDVLQDMTCYVGTSAGAYDKGVVRIRKAASSNTLFIGETSEIYFEDNDYLTVVDEFTLWAKPWVTVNQDLVYMDTDLAYFDENVNCDPVPVLGPNAVLWLTGSTVNFTPSASNSWVLGSSISSYAWTAVGASATSNMTTATPTITYNAAGTYKVSCTVTAANGKSFTGYRHVFVYTSVSMPVQQFVLSNMTSDASEGGTSFSVTMYGEATKTTVRDQAHIILFARDVYGTTEGSLGPIAGYENVLADGWIDGESIVWSKDRSEVKFTVKGPAFWLSKLVSFAVGLRDTTGTPNSWLFYNTLTVDAAAWNLLHWRSTATRCIDIFKSGDTRRASSLTTQSSNIWEQLKTIADNSIAAAPMCNRYGQLYIEVALQLRPVTDRSSIPTVMAVTSDDFEHDTLNLDRVPNSKTSIVEASGIAWDGTTGTPYISRAPGTTYKRLGAIVSKTNLLLSTQDQLNELAALMLLRDNNEYPSVPLTLAQNNRFFDICPAQYFSLTVAAGDTPRGISFTSKKFIPTRVTYSHDAETGVIKVAIDAEAEVGPGQNLLSVTVIPPATETNNYPTVTPPSSGSLINWPGTIWFPPIVSPPNNILACASDDGLPNGPLPLFFDNNNLIEEQTAYCYYPCGVRANGATNKTKVIIYDERAPGSDGSELSFEAIDKAKLVVLSPTTVEHASWYDSFEFAPVAAAEIGGFKITVNAGGSGTAEYAPGEFIKSGYVYGNDSDGIEITGLTPGDWYCIEGMGGPWYHVSTSYPGYSYGLSHDGISAGYYYVTTGTAPDMVNGINLGKPWERIFAHSIKMMANSNGMRSYLQYPTLNVPQTTYGTTGNYLTFGNSVGGNINWPGAEGWSYGPAFASVNNYLSASLAKAALDIQASTTFDGYRQVLYHEGFTMPMGAYTYPAPGFGLTVPAWGAHTEAISGTYYARTYFKAVLSSVFFKVGDSDCSGNPADQLGYILRRAVVTTENRLKIKQAYVRNICTV